MKRYRWIGALLAMVLAVAACSGGGGGASSTTSTTSASGNEGGVTSTTVEPGGAEDRRGGTMIQALSGEPASLNPAITTSTADLYTGCKIFEGLVRFDKEYNILPSLAETWEISDDGLHYTFHLRQGVTWHDGQSFTAEDVAWTFENVTSQYGPRSAAAFTRVSEITVVDDHTIELTLTEPYGSLMSLLTCSASAILPKHIYGDGVDILTHPRNNDPVGTGPFKFDSWERGTAVTLVRNENYWRADEGMPYLDRIIMRSFDSAQATIQALEAGEVDVVTDYSLDVASYNRLKDDPRFTGVGGTNNPIGHYWIFNLEREPLNDVAVRQALVKAINVALVNDKVYFGLGGVPKSHIDTRLGWAHSGEVDLQQLYPYSVEQANAELDALGLTRDANGLRFTIDLVYFIETSELEETTQILRENLREIGVDLQLRPLEQNVAQNVIWSDEDFDTFLVRFNSFGDVEVGLRRLYHCDATGPFTNPGHYCTEEVDRLLEQGAAASGPEGRAPYYHELEKVLARDLPNIPVIERPAADLLRKGLVPRQNSPDAYDGWEEVYWEQQP